MYKASNCRSTVSFSYQEKIIMVIKFASKLFCSCVFANLIILEGYNYLSFKMHLLSDMVWQAQPIFALLWSVPVESFWRAKQGESPLRSVTILLGGLWVQPTLVSPASISQDWSLSLVIGLVGKQLFCRRTSSFCKSPDFAYLFTPVTAWAVCYLVKKKTSCIQCIFCICVFSVHTVQKIHKYILTVYF